MSKIEEFKKGEIVVYELGEIETSKNTLVEILDSCGSFIYIQKI